MWNYFITGILLSVKIKPAKTNYMPNTFLKLNEDLQTLNHNYTHTND